LVPTRWDGGILRSVVCRSHPTTAICPASVQPREECLMEEYRRASESEFIKAWCLCFAGAFSGVRDFYQIKGHEPCLGCE
jgi:hypothetical protein